MSTSSCRPDRRTGRFFRLGRPVTVIPRISRFLRLPEIRISSILILWQRRGFYNLRSIRDSISAVMQAASITQSCIRRAFRCWSWRFRERIWRMTQSSGNSVKNRRTGWRITAFIWRSNTISEKKAGINGRRISGWVSRRQSLTTNRSADRRSCFSSSCSISLRSSGKR